MIDALPIIAGTIAAILHVISGPDHLAAVTPLAIEMKHKVWRIGFFWGTGHLVGMLIIGVLYLVFKALIPVEKISAYSEQLVAWVLIGVGMWTFFKLFYKEKIHCRPHIHAQETVFIHKHHSADPHQLANNHNQYLFSSFNIGILHGLAGIAHFLLLLPALGFKSTTSSVCYIIGFAIGTVIAMTVYTIVLGGLVKQTQMNIKRLNIIRVFGGVFAIIIGMYWLYLAL